MAHVNTVINGLESCIKMDCKNCPYGSYVCHGEEMLHDALSIVKASNNHVLSLDEIRQSDFVYLEFNPEKTIADHYLEACGVGDTWIKRSVCLLLKDGNAYSYKQFFNLADYNVYWRCWKSKPTWCEMRSEKWIL